jgi:hypothetical protein
MAAPVPDALAVVRDILAATALCERFAATAFGADLSTATAAAAAAAAIGALARAAS